MATEKLLAFVLKTKIALSKVNCDRKTEFQLLKPLQYKSVKAAQFADTLSILPSGQLLISYRCADPEGDRWSGHPPSPPPPQKK